MSATLLLGAEGCSETQDCDWIREATAEETAAFKARLVGDDRYKNLLVDGNGRPYWVMTILDHAPAEILEQAKRTVRTVRFGV